MMELKIGDKAPDFTLPSTGDKSITLSAYRGNPVVLYFYPKDNTSGCTKQACAFEATPMQAAVLGVSRDSVASHEKFAAKRFLNFPLLSDEDGKVCADYGVWVEKTLYGRKYMGIDRSTFLIDADGYIAAIWRKVKVAGHVEAVQEAVDALNAQGLKKIG